MKIINEYPPNYAAIAKAFDLSSVKPCFTFGDVIYNPHKANISDHLIEHELIHSIQQNRLGMTPEVWWDKYIVDSKFRLSQEAEAYRAQYRFICKMVKDKNGRFSALHRFAEDLSGPMYGKAISYNEAIKRIREK